MESEYIRRKYESRLLNWEKEERGGEERRRRGGGEKRKEREGAGVRGVSCVHGVLNIKPISSLMRCKYYGENAER